MTEQLTFYGKGEGRVVALDALARIAPSSSAPLFKVRLGDKDPYIRRAAAEGLARLGDDVRSCRRCRTPRAAIRRRWSVSAMTFALKFGQNYLSRLIDAFCARTRPRCRRRAISWNSGRRPVRTDAALQDPNSGVRAGAAGVIGALGTDDSIAVLEPLTKDRDRTVAESATVAIERIKRALSRAARMPVAGRRCRAPSTPVRRWRSRAI